MYSKTTAARVLLPMLMGSLLAGCPPRDGGGSTTLTAEQEEAVNVVAADIAATAGVFSSLTPFSATQLRLSGIENAGAFGACPQVTFTTDPQRVTALFNFTASGCTGSGTGGATFRGSADVGIERGTADATVQFRSFAIDSHEITGQLELNVQNTTTGATLEGSIDATTSAIDHLDGTFTLEISRTGELTLADADLAFENDGTTLDVEAARLLMNPTENGSFMPESGAATFDLQGETGEKTVTISIEFTAQSPEDGTVIVRVNGGPAIMFQLAGFPT